MKTPTLDAGESDAIALSLEQDAAAILIDERRGRMLARQLGLITLGTLAIIDEAASRGLCDLDAVLSALANTNFRVHRSLIGEIQRRHREPSE